MSRSCGTCARGFTRPNGLIACGAPVDDASLSGDGPGLNAIWAERKYGRATIIGLMVGRPMPEGTDCGNMRPDDGANCKLWADQ